MIVLKDGDCTHFMNVKILNQRSVEILNAIVDVYIDSGEAVGSKLLSERFEHRMSSATIRNVMAQLEEMNLIFSPHVSSGRIPTEKGLRFFVDSFLESNLTLEDEEPLKEEALSQGKNFDDIIERTTTILSSLSQCASLVFAPKVDQSAIKHVEFLPLSDQKGLVIIVSEDGAVENRIIKMPPKILPFQLEQASNYINRNFSGRPLSEIKTALMQALNQDHHELDALSQKLIHLGLAVWSDDESSLIVKGQSHLLNNVQHLDDLDRMQRLFNELETKENLNELLEASLDGDGIKLFIGAEHELFEKSGCSLVMSPYHNKKGAVVGVIGVIGPISMNYRRIIPMVNYSAKLISKLLQSS